MLRADRSDVSLLQGKHLLTSCAWPPTMYTWWNAPKSLNMQAVKEIEAIRHVLNRLH